MARLLAGLALLVAGLALLAVIWLAAEASTGLRPPDGGPANKSDSVLVRDSERVTSRLRIEAPAPTLSVLAQDGRLVEGAEVVVAGARGQEVKGRRYVIGAEVGDTAPVDIVARGFWPWSRELRIEQENTVRLTPRNWLELCVVDAVSTVPVPTFEVLPTDVVVKQEHPQVGCVWLRASGRGGFAVGVAAPGYPFQEVWVKGHNRRAVVELLASCSLAGVVRSRDGAPLSGVEVVDPRLGLRGEPLGVTAEDGSFSVEVAPVDGAVNLQLRKEGCVRLEFRRRGAPGGRQWCGEVEVPEAAIVFGVVTGADGHPVVGAGIVVAQGSLIRSGVRGLTTHEKRCRKRLPRGWRVVRDVERLLAVTSKDGSYRVDGVVPGTVRQRVWVTAGDKTVGKTIPEVATGGARYQCDISLR